MTHPHIIQGGMGAGVSDWRLARAVAQEGAMGVVSGTAMDIILARRLQQGDPDGHMRRGLAAFPDQDVAQRILERYFRPENDRDFHRFQQLPMVTVDPPAELLELLVAASFVEVFLAKEGHAGKVGINYLEKIQLPNPAAIYGAMLAGVDYVLMGAGIPLEIPGLLDRFSQGQPAEIRLAVDGAEKGEVFMHRFDPAQVLADPPTSLVRPAFLAIVASNVLAQTMTSRATGTVDGLVVEDFTAGGHNAPPRGPLQLNERGEPVYGVKDQVDLERMNKLGIPYWLGGSRSDPGSLTRSEQAGARGIQVGTLFAFCRESGFLPELKRRFLAALEAGRMKVLTHPEASPTGYPIKMAQLEGTLAQDQLFLQRKRVCNLGLLRHLYKKENGRLGYRCPAEPIEAYTKKGGEPARATNARCLCNALLSAVDLAMEYAGGYLEKPILVPGEYLDSLKALVRSAGMDFTAADVVAFLRGKRTEQA